MPPKKPPLAPGALTATALSPTEVHLHWQDRANNEARVGIERAIGDDNFIPIAEVTKNVTEFDARQLQPNTRYRFRVRAFNNYGSSAYANLVTITTPAVLVPPVEPHDPPPSEPPPIVIPPVEPPPVVEPPPSGTKRLVTQSLIRYLGAMRTTVHGADMAFSYGTLTGRKVNGEVRLLMTGNTVAGDPLHEFADTGSYHPDPAQAPYMPLVRVWGDIYGQARKTWRADGTEKVGYPRRPGGLLWNETTQLLYWVYYDTYNVTGDEDWCLGATRLDSGGQQAFGPWRPSGGGKRGSWRCVSLAKHPTTGELLCGSGLMSGNIGSPWGPDLWSGPFPTASTPSGFGAPDLPVQKYLTYYPMIGRIDATDGSFTAPIRSCRRPGDYIYEPFTGGGSATEIDPTKNNGIGSWTQLDAASSCVWLDLPDVEGVIFLGRFAAGHLWYRNSALGADRCSHGLAAPVDVTGPVSTDAYPTLLIYRPSDLAAVRAGTQVDYTVDPAAIINGASAWPGLVTAPMEMSGGSRSFSGLYFDPEARKLYVAAPNADGTTLGLVHPLVHVFQVN